MTTTRTDIHRPSAPEFDPTAYRVAGYFDNHPEDGNVADRVATVVRLINFGFTFGHGSAAYCGHCGANMRYSILLTHSDSRTFIFVGETCMANRFAGSLAEFRAMRERAAAINTRRRIAAIRDAFVATHPEIAFLLDSEHPDREIVDGSCFLNDLARSLRASGSLSDRQVIAATRAVRSERERSAGIAARRAARAAERHLGSLKERITITGEITHAMTVDGYAYGTSQRFVVIRTPEGSVTGYSGARWAYAAQVGDVVTAQVTVKAHGEHDGGPTTRVGNFKIISNSREA